MSDDIYIAADDGVLEPLVPTGVFHRGAARSPKFLRGARGNALGEETMARLFIEGGKRGYAADSHGDPDVEARLWEIRQRMVGSFEDGALTGGKGYVDFLLSGVQASFQEITETSIFIGGGHTVHAYGEHLPSYSFSGTLLNTHQDDQAVSMLLAYQNLFRAKKLAQHQTLLSVRYDSWIVQGVVTGFQFSMEAQMEMALPFSFSLLAQKVISIPTKLFYPVDVEGGFDAGTSLFGSTVGGLSLGALPTALVNPVAAPPEAVKPAAANKAEEKAKEDVTPDAAPETNSYVIDTVIKGAKGASDAVFAGTGSILTSGVIGTDQIESLYHKGTNLIKRRWLGQ